LISQWNSVAFRSVRRRLTLSRVAHGVNVQEVLVEFGAGDHPFLSRPDDFAESIVAAIDRS